MTRILSAIILIPLAILTVIYAPPVYFLVAIGIVGTFCLREYSGLIGALGITAQPVFSYAAFWLLLVAFYQDRFPAIIAAAFVMIAAFLSAMSRHRQSARNRTFGLMAEFLGIFYFALCLFPALRIRYDFGDRVGLGWFIILLAVIWAGDTAALAFGKLWGAHPLSPVLSPHKTYEGAVAGLLAGVAAAVVLQQLIFSDLPFLHAVVVSLLLGIFGQLGDLAESMLKRAAAIKDSSNFIPGHGGVLDRMDSLLFAFPVLYFYLFLIYP